MSVSSALAGSGRYLNFVAELGLIGLLLVGIAVTLIVVIVVITVAVGVGLGMEKHFDRKRQARLTAILKEAVTTLNEHGVEYFLDYGTLLGVVRDNQFLIEGDLDFDITVLNHHRVSCEAALSTNTKLQVFGKNRGMLRICLVGMSPIYVGDIRFAEVREGRILHDYGGSFAKDSIFPLQGIDLEGIGATIPRDPHPMLREYYGPDCMTKRRKCVTGWRRDPSKLTELRLIIGWTWRDILRIPRISKRRYGLRL